MTVITPIPLVPRNPSNLCATCRLVANHDTTQKYYARPLKIAAVRGCVLVSDIYIRQVNTQAARRPSEGYMRNLTPSHVGT